MLDLSLFRIARFVGVQVLPVSTCCCYIVLLVVLPLRFIGVDGFSEIDAGWLMLAISAPMLIVPFIAATLTRWLSAGVISGSGPVRGGRRVAGHRCAAARGRGDRADDRDRRRGRDAVGLMDGCR